MADRRCSYCGRREGEGHPFRCGVTRHGLDPAYEECIDDVRAERERYRQALEKIARQGPGGKWSSELRTLVDNDGEPWVHWAERAERALNQKENTDA